VKAVRFDKYGGVDVLEVREVEDPVAGPGEVLVAVKAASINPGEIAIREGFLDARWPASFPSGEGSDFAGIVDAVGAGVDEFEIGDEVIGWTEQRASQAELVVAPLEHVTAKPAGLSWEVAGALFVAPMAAWASVDAVDLKPGEIVVISAAAGGVGSIAVQLAHAKGATVVGLASERNHQWLRDHGAIPVTYGEGQVERIKQAVGEHLDAFIDTFGGGYVEIAVNELGIPLERINTIADFEAVERLGVSSQGTHAIATREILAELAAMVVAGELEIPIAKTYPLSEVRAAYEELARRDTRGKIVLLT
jgi:NADPH:quinone reductase-like Zn-dependent oxidoreductase